MINNLPTIYEVVTGTVKKQTKEKTPKSSSKNNKSGTKVTIPFILILTVWPENVCSPMAFFLFIPNAYTAATPAGTQLGQL
jgi:hypothetical protein